MSGQNVFRGMNYQARSALLLFLININNPEFESITLEDKKWNDFTLNFSSGRRIICEAKNLKKPLGKTAIKRILESVIAKPTQLEANDEILIICPSLQPKLFNKIKANRFIEIGAPNALSTDFSTEQIKLLSRTSFQFFSNIEFLEQELNAYFPSHLTFWLPDAEVKGLLSKVLIEHVYEKSSLGANFSRKDLNNEIAKYIASKIDLNHDYDNKKTEARERIRLVLEKVRNKDHNGLERDLTVLSANPSLMLITLDAIFSQKQLNLQEWDYIFWKLATRQYAFPIVRNFAASIESEQNASYVIELLEKQMEILTQSISKRELVPIVLELIRNILKLHPSLALNILQFVRNFLDRSNFDFFLLETADSTNLVKGSISKLLLNLFNLLTTDEESINLVLSIISKHFSLTQDDGDYLIFTPFQIFDLLREYLEIDFKMNTPILVGILANQFKSSKFSNGEFRGFENFGGSVSGIGNLYTMADRAFITNSLRPAARQFLNQGGESAWTFIRTKFIATDDSEISEEKPDFLGRTAIPLLIERLISGQNTDEIMEILKSQLVMSRGIPSKYEVIFQELNHQSSFPLQQKWELACVFLDQHSSVQSVFLEKLILDLAMNGHEGALQALATWAADPQYSYIQTGKTLFHSEGILKLLSLECKSKGFAEGLEMVKNFLKSPEFIDTANPRDLVEISQAIGKVIEKNFEIGIAILRDIVNCSETFTSSEQLFLAHTIESVDKSNAQLLSRIFEEFLAPLLLGELDANNALIEEKFSEAYARQLLVQYGEHLASVGLFRQAMELACIFVKDSDPGLENRPDDPQGEWNYHSRIISGVEPIVITTVRGHCAWLLSNFCVASAKDFIPKTLELVSLLTKDPNYYIRVQASIALANFASARNSYLPLSNQTERFMSPSEAETVEEILFAMLLDAENRSHSVIMMYLLRAFNQVRTLNEEQARYILDSFLDLPSWDAKPNISALLVYYAHFRYKAFDDVIFERLFGTEAHSKLKTFNPEQFIHLLEDVTKNGSENLKAGIAWQMWQLPKSKSNSFEGMFELSIKYFRIIATQYSHDAFSNLREFLVEFLEIKPKECLELWKLASMSERDYLKQYEEELLPYDFYSFYENSRFLVKVLDTLGQKDYFEMLNILLAYPKKFELNIEPIRCYETLLQIGESGSRQLKELCERYEWLYVRELDGDIDLT